jgi:hypothetical protein
MERQVYTPGYMSQVLQRSPREIEADLYAAGYRPELIINEISHWATDCLIFLRRRRPFESTIPKEEKTES